jgi:DNA-binding XRE family transcriptional regulator
MLDRIKTHTIGQLAKINLTATVPAKQLALVTEALRSVLALAGQAARPVNEEGEELYAFDEVFPEVHSGLVVCGYRGKMEMTQEELAERLGIRQTRVSELESSQRAISAAMAKRLGKIFDISYKAFL